MVEIRVPATSANLGPGFDAFGMAFQLYNIFQVKERQDGKLLISGVAKRYQNKNNLFYQAMQQIFRRVCYHPKGLTIHCDIHIPFSRGLGSSASCIAGGMLAANAISGNILSRNEVLDLAVKMEGHGDNMAAAFYGGLVVSFEQKSHTSWIKNTVSETYAFFAIIPDYSVWTGNARNILPESLSHEDAAFNVSHAVITYLALTQNQADILKIAMQDRLHQPYRKKLIRDFDLLEKKAYAHGALGVCISGSGPTVLIITEQAKKDDLSAAMKKWLASCYPDWEMILLQPDSEGARITYKKDGD